MKRKLITCPKCKRLVPTNNGQIVFHYIQDKGWVNSENKRDECSGSNRRIR